MEGGMVFRIRRHDMTRHDTHVIKMGDRRFPRTCTCTGIRLERIEWNRLEELGQSVCRVELQWKKKKAKKRREEKRRKIQIRNSSVKPYV